MGLFNKSKPKEDKKKQPSAVGPHKNHEITEKVPQNGSRLGPKAEDHRKQHTGQVSSRERPLPPPHERPLTPSYEGLLPRPRAEFPINGPVHDDPEELFSQKDMDIILTENKTLKKTIDEIEHTLDGIREDDIPRLDVKMEVLRQELRIIVQGYLKSGFDKSKFEQWVKSIENDAEQLADNVCVIHALFSETNKDDWKPLLWKRTFKSFDQVDKRADYQKLFNHAFPGTVMDNSVYVDVCKKIGRVILQNRYASIPESDRKTSIFESKEIRKKASFVDCGNRSQQHSSSVNENYQTIHKKASKASIIVSKEGNRLSVYEIDELQKTREKGVPKRTSSLMAYMDESILTQLKEDGISKK